MTLLPLVILCVGVCASALSVVFIRETTEAPIMLAAWRVLIAGLLLLPLYYRDQRRHGSESLSAVIQRSWFPGVILGVHFIAWVVGARMTPAANANLIVNILPVVMPFFMFAMFSERIGARELVATIIAIAGMLLLGASDFSISQKHFQGDLVCLFSMLLFAVYLALARRNKDVPTVWLYVVPVYLIAGVSTFIVALFFSSPFRPYTAYDLCMILALAVVSTVIGHSALNYAMQHLRGQTVSVVNMGQFVVGGIAGFLLYQEIPRPAFYLASALLVLAMWLVISGDDQVRRSVSDEKKGATD
ncbi:MAG: DMT family transporter [Granulosicoccus sp.]|nr:DMT family transporter [Granulosicoccus sp.]